MKFSSLLRATYVAMAALALTATMAFAGIGDPIQGVPVGLEGDPGSIVIAKGVTDGKGQFNFGNLAPGKYMLIIDGKGLALALKKIDPKGLPHTIRVSFGLADQKPIVVSDLPYNGGDAASLRVSVADSAIIENLARTKPHYYVGIVSLLK